MPGEMKIPGYLLIVILAVCQLQYAGAASAADKEEVSDIKGKISDVDGNAVAGAKVYVYSNRDVRRAADYISAPSDMDGVFRVAVPAGNYWVIARLKKAEGFVPLMPGDKHSGDPQEIDVAAGEEAEIDFTVADLREAIKMKKDEKQRPVKLSGRIVNIKGKPVTNAYAFANRTEEIVRIPDYISAWVDSEGRYTLYVPEGEYYIGEAEAFPPGEDYFITGRMVIESEKTDMDIIRPEKE